MDTYDVPTSLLVITCAAYCFPTFYYFILTTCYVWTGQNQILWESGSPHPTVEDILPSLVSRLDIDDEEAKLSNIVDDIVVNS